LAIRLLEFSPIQVFCYRPRARIAAGEAILLKAGRSSLWSFLPVLICQLLGS